MNSTNQHENQNYDYNSRLETGFGPMTDKILNVFLERITSNNFKELLTDKIVSPVTQIVNEKIKPYVYISLALYMIIIFLLLFIIYILLRKKHICILDK